MTHRINLPCGRIALIDACDAELVSGYDWRAQGSEENRSQGLYVVAWDGEKTVILHRLIMNAPRGVPVDHRNHDTLDNRRANLRLCTVQQNAQNRRPNANTKLGLKGVTPTHGRFQVSIRIDGAARYLGTFREPYAAALAYDDAASAAFGEFARLNFDRSRDWIINGRHVGAGLHRIGSDLGLWGSK